MSAKYQLFYTLVFRRPLFTGSSGLQLCTHERASITIGPNTYILKFIARVIRVENNNQTHTLFYIESNCKSKLSQL